MNALKQSEQVHTNHEYPRLYTDYSNWTEAFIEETKKVFKDTHFITLLEGLITQTESQEAMEARMTRYIESLSLSRKSQTEALKLLDWFSERLERALRRTKREMLSPEKLKLLQGQYYKQYHGERKHDSAYKAKVHQFDSLLLEANIAKFSADSNTPKELLKSKVETIRSLLEKVIKMAVNIPTEQTPNSVKSGTQSSLVRVLTTPIGDLFKR